MGSIYDGQADRAICEFCDVPTRAREPTSESPKRIQPARAEYDLRAARLPRAKFYVASPSEYRAAAIAPVQKVRTDPFASLVCHYVAENSLLQFL